MLKLMKTLLPVRIILATAFVAMAGDLSKALGLVATAEPVPICCNAAECSINLLAFCIQQKCQFPTPSDLYRPAATHTIQVSAQTLEAAQALLDEKVLTFRSESE